MERKGSAVWTGNLKNGKGQLSVVSRVLFETPYSFKTRFGDGEGTNPEELIAAAHAGCFSMALSNELGKAGLTAERIDTTATVRIEAVGGGFAIPAIHLDVRAKIPGADPAAFEAAAKSAKTGCPVSKLFNAQITMSAKLEP